MSHHQSSPELRDFLDRLTGALVEFARSWPFRAEVAQMLAGARPELHSASDGSDLQLWLRIPAADYFKLAFVHDEVDEVDDRLTEWTLRLRCFWKRAHVASANVLPDLSRDEHWRLSAQLPVSGTARLETDDRIRGGE